jgi:hypothetical protein
MVFHINARERRRLMLDAKDKTGKPLRGDRRHPVILPLTYLVDGNSSVQLGHVIDIGGGGMHFESKENLPKDVSITVWFELPESKIEARGRVLASNSIGRAKDLYENRIAFAPVSDEVRASIEAFVAKAWLADLTAQAQLHGNSEADITRWRRQSADVRR